MAPSLKALLTVLIAFWCLVVRNVLPKGVQQKCLDAWNCKAGHYQRLFEKCTLNLSIDFVGYRLLINREKYIFRSVVANLKFVTKKAELIDEI